MIDRLVVRAEASPKLGLGHLMRSLALVEAAQRQGLDVRVVTQHVAVTEVVGERAAVSIIETENEWHEDVGPSVAVLFDGYRFGPDDHEAVRSRGAVVAAMDDEGTGQYPVDVLVNQNLVDEPRYDTLESTRVLCGPRYALVRREFRDRRRLRGKAPGPVLVTMGGSDTKGLTGPVARACVEGGPFDNATVLLGPLAVRPSLPVEVEVIQHPDSVAEVFDRCEVAVSAAGATAWELLCMGMPCALIEVADNQRHIGRPLGDRGAALFVGALPLDRDRMSICIDSLADHDICRELSSRALTLVDGRGADRVLDALMYQA